MTFTSAELQALASHDAKVDQGAILIRGHKDLREYKRLYMRLYMRQRRLEGYYRRKSTKTQGMSQ